MVHRNCPRPRRVLKPLIAVVLIVLFLYLGKYIFVASGLYAQVEFRSLKGYFHCTVNVDDPQVFFNYSRMYPCDFQPPPNRNGPIILTFINAAWLPLARNWVCSAEKVGLLQNIYLISFEHGVCSSLPNNVNCYEHPHVTVRRTAFGMRDYQKLVIERTKIILQFLSCNQNLALVDADVVFMKNPMEFLNQKLETTDIVFQSDSIGVQFADAVIPYFFKYICGGFIYMEPNYSTRRLWLTVLNYQQTFFWNDQAGLNVCIRHYSQSVVWDILPGAFFPSGKQFFFYNESNVDEVMIVHANHLQGMDKLIRMVGSNVWCSEKDALALCKDRATFASRCGQRVSLDKLPRWCKDFARICQDKYGMKVIT